MAEARLEGVKRRVLRYWFPKLGGKRQCLKCGFLGRKIPTPDGSGISQEGYEVTASDRERILSAKNYVDDALDSNSGFTGCLRGIWLEQPITMKLHTEASRPRGCTLFFPYHQGIQPEAHLELKREASNRWWTFWAVLGATGIGGSISGLIVAFLK